MSAFDRFNGVRATGHSFAALPALQPLLHRARRCRSTPDVAAVAVDHLCEVFDTNTCGVIFADSEGRAAEAAIEGMSDDDFCAYETSWRQRNRVFATLLERQAAVHRRQVWSDEEWPDDPLYREFGKKIGLYQYMAAPLYGFDGQLMGLMAICRPEGRRPFDAADLQFGNAMGGYLSAVLAKLSSPKLGEEVYPAVNISVRESEVISLVASGLNNLEISHALNISRNTVKETLRRIYHKLEVRSRAQMVARLAELRRP